MVDTDNDWDRDRDGVPDSIDAQVDEPGAYEAMDADADGVPDALDAEVGPERESLMTSTLTNVANMKHESLKGIAQNLRG